MYGLAKCLICNLEKGLSIQLVVYRSKDWLDGTLRLFQLFSPTNLAHSRPYYDQIFWHDKDIHRPVLKY